MRISVQLKVLAGCIVFTLLGVAATRLPDQQPRNLKVLPADIADAKLDSIMESWNKALGVNCDFCHVKKKIYPGDWDYASDAEPMKENAREMLRMTIDINKTHFWYDKNKEPVYLNTVSCRTCHRGQPFPVD